MRLTVTLYSYKSPTYLLLFSVEDSFPKFLTLDTSTEQETVGKGQDDKKSEEDSDKCQNDIQNNSNSLNSETKGHSDTEPLHVEQNIAPCDVEQCKSRGITEASVEKRGVKRKRDDDDDDDDYNEKDRNSSCETQGINSYVNAVSWLSLITGLQTTSKNVL